MATTKSGFNYKRILTDHDIIEQARIVAEASKKIQEIKEAQKEVKNLQEKIITHSKYIQEGAIERWTRGVFEWHKPNHGLVTVSFDEDYRKWGFTPFEPFFRVMTEEELKEYCELEIPFEQEDEIIVTCEEEAEKAKNRLRAVGWNVTEEDLNEMVEIQKPEDDDQDISEIFGVTTIDDPPQPESIPEDPAPAYRIEQCESTKYPWNILEGIGKEAIIFERFRTKEEAETFLTLFNENKIPENSPGAEWIIEKGLGGWKVKKCQYENGRLLKSTFHTMLVCYFEAKQMCENFNSEAITSDPHSPSEMKIVSENDRYQIVETPDGGLKTILKTTTDECIPAEEVR